MSAAAFRTSRLAKSLFEPDSNPSRRYNLPRVAGESAVLACDPATGVHIRTHLIIIGFFLSPITTVRDAKCLVDGRGAVAATTDPEELPTRRLVIFFPLEEVRSPPARSHDYLDPYRLVYPQPRVPG